MATELPPVDRVRGPDGVERPLMAAHIVTSTVANVRWTVGQLRQSDRFQLTETLLLLQVQTVRKHALPMLRTVVVEVLHTLDTVPTTAGTRPPRCGRTRVTTTSCVWPTPRTSTRGGARPPNR